MKFKTSITCARLKEVLTYHPDTGCFTRNYSIRDKLVGSVAGYKEKTGYITIIVDQVGYKAHRLAWLYMTGEFPSIQVDHTNMNKSDNRWDNLRLADNSQNQMNTTLSSRNISGYRGVSWNKREKKWKVTCVVKNKMHHLGYFHDVKEAATVYSNFAQQHHGSHWMPLPPSPDNQGE